MDRPLARRRLSRIALLTGMLACTGAGAAGAGAFNLEATQLVRAAHDLEDFAEQQQQTLTQLELMANRAAALADQIEDAVRLEFESTAVDEVRELVQNVQGFMTQAGQLSYQAENAWEQIQGTYKDFDAFAMLNYGRADFAQDYAEWNRQTREGISGVLRSMHLSESQIEAESDAVEILMDAITNSTSKETIFAANGQLTGVLATSMQKARQLIALGNQVLATFVQQESAREQVQRAVNDKLFSSQRAAEAGQQLPGEKPANPALFSFAR